MSHEHSAHDRRPGSGEGPRVVRHAVAEVLGLTGWDDAAIEDAMLVASELVTNALRHGGGMTGLALSVDGRTMLLSIHNAASGPALAAPVSPPPAEEPTGRGLFLVEQIADDWGARPLLPEGTCVWCRLIR